MLTDRGIGRRDVHRMIQRRALDAGIATDINCHTFRATGITEFLNQGGTIEQARLIAAHEVSRTTQLYDRRSDVIALEAVERITARFDALIDNPSREIANRAQRKLQAVS